MKITFIVMLAILLVLVGGALYKGNGLLFEGSKNASLQLIKFLPILFVVFFIMGLLEVLLPKDFIQNWLSDAAGYKGILVGWVAGALTPGGSIMAFPIVATLYSKGVSLSILITYITSLTLLSFIRFPLEVSFYGGKITTVRVIASLLLPPIAGIITRLITPLFVR